MAMPLWMIANIRILMSCRPNFQHVRSRARSHGPVPRPTIRTITRASWLPSKMTCAKKRWRRREFEGIAARVGNMQARWLRLTVRDSRTPTTRTQKLSRRLLRNERSPRRVSRKAAMMSLLISTPIPSSDESELLRSLQALTEKRRVPCVAGGNGPERLELGEEGLDQMPGLVE